MKKAKCGVLLLLAASILTCSAVSIRVENFTTNSVQALVDGDDYFTYPPGITDFSVYSTNVNVTINADEGWVCQDGYGFGDTASVILRLSTRFGDTRATLFEVNRPDPEILEARLFGIEQDKVAYAGIGGLGIGLAALYLFRKVKKTS